MTVFIAHTNSILKYELQNTIKFYIFLCTIYLMLLAIFSTKRTSTPDVLYSSFILVLNTIIYHFIRKYTFSDRIKKIFYTILVVFELFTLILIITYYSSYIRFRPGVLFNILAFQLLSHLLFYMCYISVKKYANCSVYPHSMYPSTMQSDIYSDIGNNVIIPTSENNNDYVDL